MVTYRPSSKQTLDEGSNSDGRTTSYTCNPVPDLSAVSFAELSFVGLYAVSFAELSFVGLSAVSAGLVQ